MKALTFFLSSVATLGMAALLSTSTVRLSNAEAASATGGLPLPGMRCVTIGDCTIWNMANMLLCPNAAGCTVCDSEELVRGCFIGSASEVCDYQGSRTTDCGSVLAGTCAADGSCQNLIFIPGSVCGDGPKCE